MISEAKINQVLSAIRENGIKSFDTDSLVKLLSILNKQELEAFKVGYSVVILLKEENSRIQFDIIESHNLNIVITVKK